MEYIIRAVQQVMWKSEQKNSGWVLKKQKVIKIFHQWPLFKLKH